MIRLLVMDVDGTLTNGKLYIGIEGEEFKAFNIKDGYGIKNILPTYNVLPAIISGRKSNIVKNRCAELGIRRLFQGVENKLQTLWMLIDEIGVLPNEVAYIGDDDNDIECMKYILNNGGVIGCPSDSSESVSSLQGVFVCKAAGGNGAVREFINHITK